MKELRQIRDAVISALRAEGLAAEAASPGKWAAERKMPLASVSVGAAAGRALGLGGYLGQTRDGKGEVREVYGKRLEGVITVDVRAERAEDCEMGGETAASALLGASAWLFFPLLRGGEGREIVDGLLFLAGALVTAVEDLELLGFSPARALLCFLAVLAAFAAGAALMAARVYKNLGKSAEIS